MVTSFLESFKHVGHLIPVAGLRIYLGFNYIYEFSNRYSKSFLSKDYLPSVIKERFSEQLDIGGYKQFIISHILDRWQFVAYLILICLLFIGTSFILGFMVKMSSLVAIFLSLNVLILGSGVDSLLHQVLIGVNLTFFLVGAGRCVGIDYYFYKKTRGLFW